jgi:hypothetical protein
VLPMMATAATKRSLLNMVLWRWWPMGEVCWWCVKGRKFKSAFRAIGANEVGNET